MGRDAGRPIPTSIRADSLALADGWFDALDTNRAGRLLPHDFALLALLIPKTPGAPVPPQGPDTQTGTWPAFNRMIGGYFKFHWLDPQKVTVKIDDPSSPLTAMFGGRSFDVHDEIYTMGANSWSRENVRVLTSIDYDRMSAEDRALEDRLVLEHLLAGIQYALGDLDADDSPSR